MTLDAFTRSLVLAALASIALAARAGPMDSAMPMAAAASASTLMVDGEVRRVDLAAAKLTLRHGAIANLEMDPMTMVYRVADPKLLNGLSAGQKVRFHAERMDGNLVVTRIEPAR